MAYLAFAKVPSPQKNFALGKYRMENLFCEVCAGRIAYETTEDPKNLRHNLPL